MGIKNVYAHLFEVAYEKKDLDNIQKYFDLLKSNDWIIDHKNTGKYSSFTPYEARLKIVQKDYIEASKLFHGYIYKVVSDEDRETIESIARDYYEYLVALKKVDNKSFIEQYNIAIELPNEPGNHVWKNKIFTLKEEKL